MMYTKQFRKLKRAKLSTLKKVIFLGLFLVSFYGVAQKEIYFLKKSTTDITIYPNPTVDVAYLSRASEWELVSLNGSLIANGKGSEIDLTKYASGGLYLLRLPNHNLKMEVQKKVYDVGQEVSVQLLNNIPVDSKSWVGVFKSTSPSTAENLIVWEYANKLDKNGLVKLIHGSFIKEQGDYEVRLFKGEGYQKLLAKDDFFVTDDNIIDIRDYGAVCDGVTNDSEAINEALKVAAREKKAVQFNREGVCLLNESLIVFNGVTQIFDGNIKFTNPRSNGIHLFGKRQSQQSNVKDFRIHHINIEMSKIDYSGAITGYNVSKVRIDHNTIENKEGISFIGLYTFKSGIEESVDNTISYNKIKSASYAKGVSINIWSQPDFVYPLEEYTDPTDGKIKNYAPATWLWMKDKTYAKPYYETLRTTISHNEIDGGYYSIGLSGVSDSTIENNKIINNMRNISMQNGSHRNRVANNTLRNSVSASIHLAYGSSDNMIINNNISTSVAHGESLLQAYVGAKRNLFKDNIVECTSPKGARWMLYFALHADGNKAIGNKFIGSYHRACIAVEPAWDETVKHIAHRGSYLVRWYRHHVWANQDTDGIVIKDNVLDVYSVDFGGEFIPKNQPEIFISQIKDELGEHKVTHLTLENNKIVNPNPNYKEPVFFIDDEI